MKCFTWLCWVKGNALNSACIQRSLIIIIMGSLGIVPGVEVRITTSAICLNPKSLWCCRCGNLDTNIEMFSFFKKIDTIGVGLIHLFNEHCTEMPCKGHGSHRNICALRLCYIVL